MSVIVTRFADISANSKPTLSNAESLKSSPTEKVYFIERR